MVIIVKNDIVYSIYSYNQYGIYLHSKAEKGKYYVGKTSNPNFRIESHFNSEGTEWTKMYKPEKLLEIIDGDDYDEDKYTNMYMDKYGIDNVRGGSYTSIILDKETKNHLVKNSNSTNDRCFKCGKEGHFASNCWSHKSSAAKSSKNAIYAEIMDIMKLIVINFKVIYLNLCELYVYQLKTDIRIRHIIYNMGAIPLIYIQLSQLS
jgi:hypothetical protein